jgi:hypothetical protein
MVYMNVSKHQTAIIPFNFLPILLIISLYTCAFLTNNIWLCAYFTLYKELHG